MEFLNAVFGTEAGSRDMGILRMIARGVFVYLALVVLMRLGKKRFLGDATVFDMVLSVIIGAI
jgi:uncharacterized membrane protein YcaP (DUF421 family)